MDKAIARIRNHLANKLTSRGALRGALKSLFAKKLGSNEVDEITGQLKNDGVVRAIGRRPEYKFPMAAVVE